MSKKILLTVIAVMLVVVPVSACTEPAEEPPLKMGGIFCMTGPLAAMGDLISQGALLAVDEINADGGVLGRDLELVIEDSATNDATAFEAYKKLVEVDASGRHLEELDSQATQSGQSVVLTIDLELQRRTAVGGLRTNLNADVAQR